MFEPEQRRDLLEIVEDRYSAGSLIIPAMRGRQGMRRMPGLGRTIGDDAHALALGKVALSMLSPEGLARYIDRGLRRHTEATIVRPDRLFVELEDIRQTGIATDVEEYEPDFCCLAAPVFAPGGRAVAIIGISMSRHSYEQEGDELSSTVRDVASQARLRLAERSETALPENGGRS